MRTMPPGFCNRPDRDSPGIPCGYPLPCPWHTTVLDGPLLSAPVGTSETVWKHLKEIQEAGRAPEAGR